MGMLLIMLSTAALTECGKGECKGGVCALKPNKQKQAQMKQSEQAAKAQAQAQALQMQAARDKQAQLRQKAQARGAEVRAGIRAKALAAKEAMKGTAKPTVMTTTPKAAELAKAKGMMEAKTMTTEEAKAALASETPPPLPPKRARRIAEAPAAQEQPAPRGETWGEMFARHGETLMGHTG